MATPMSQDASCLGDGLGELGREGNLGPTRRVHVTWLGVKGLAKPSSWENRGDSVADTGAAARSIF
jgi:hypothetical protein